MQSVLLGQRLFESYSDLGVLPILPKRIIAQKRPLASHRKKGTTHLVIAVSGLHCLKETLVGIG